MNSPWNLTLTIILAQAVLLTAPVSQPAQQAGISISDPASIKTEFDSVPCKNDER
jgi:hypothetical protein